MLNTVAKGSRNQLKTRKYLEEEGWIVYTVVRVKFKPDHDIFGLFDHVAWKDGNIRFVQTKSNRCPKSVLDEIREFETPNGVTKQVFVWIDYQKQPDIIAL
jgi:hypothetical protein